MRFKMLVLHQIYTTLKKIYFIWITNEGIGVGQYPFYTKRRVFEKLIVDIRMFHFYSEYGFVIMGI